MNIERFARLAVIGGIASLSLGGCATYGNLDGEYDPDAFGEANRQTYAAMIDNPEPEYDAPMDGNAEKANAAIERYRTDTVKEPDTVRSTETPGGR